VLDKERLMEAVWPDSIVEENNLTQNISALRRVFGETPGSHQYIVTVPGRGYRFVAEVKMREADADSQWRRIPETSIATAEDKTEQIDSVSQPDRPATPQFQANVVGDRSRARADCCYALSLARSNARST
jgi:DNA-binding winged helix-turn-helix (wHTH) protein